MCGFDNDDNVCMIALCTNVFQSRKSTYDGATPSELMEALFTQSACSYRVSTYKPYCKSKKCE